MSKHKKSSPSRRDFLRMSAGAAVGLGVPSLAFSGSSIDNIKKRGYLLYGFNGQAPYNFLEPDGSLVGSEIAITREICKRIGIDVVQGIAMDFASFIPAIQAGRIDTCLPIFVKPPRCKILIYCTPHLKLGQGAIVATGNPKGIGGWDDLVNKDVTVGIVAGTTPNEIAKNAGVPDSRIVRVPDTTALTAVLRSGRVDTIVEASAGARLIMEDLKGESFERVVGWTKPSNISKKIEFQAAFPFNQRDTDLRDAFDREIKAMLADGTVDELSSPFGLSAADRPTADDPTLEEECTEA